MTLYRQLLIFTLVLFIVLFIGVCFEKLQSTRTFLTNQLEAHAQDTATSLGLSLSPVLAEKDLSTVDTMMNAVFDRGYYRRIALEDVYGKVITERDLIVEFEGVPAWFVSMIPLKTPVAESLITTGWTQAGKLYVESHPGFAYRTLWETVVQVGAYFLLSGGVVLILGAMGLKYLLAPLKKVEQQAEAICRKEYTIQEKLPHTRELRQVVTSMNKMTAKVKDMFSEQSKVAERLRRNAYSDQLTGLGNRRYMTGQVEAHLENISGSTTGALILLQVVELQEINQVNGFEAGDTLLKKVAEVIKGETSKIRNVALARLTGGDYAVFLPEISEGEATELTEKISNNVAKLAFDNLSHIDNISHVGCVVYDHKPTLPQLLSEADNALHSARQKGPNMVSVMSLLTDKQQTIKGKTWWKKTLEDVLEKESVLLYGQSVVKSRERDETLHLEILSRIVLADNEIVSAGVFIPFAEQMGMISLLDKTVIKQLIRRQKRLGVKRTVAVNISPSSVGDTEFVDWLLGTLKAEANSSLKIIFELPEFGAVQHIDAAREFSEAVQKLGHGVGLDHFGQSFSNFGYLRSLKPEYVKIDRAFTNELEQEHGDSEFFIEALCGVAHSLDVKVIAEGVEQEQQVERLLELNIDALQGYLFGTPEQLD